MAMQTPEKQILPIAPNYPDLVALTRWAGDLTRTLQQNLATIARKANDTDTVPLTGNLNASGFNITNIGSLGNISGTITYKGADIDARYVNVTGDTMTGALALGSTLSMTGSNAGLEIGAVASANTPHIDFHSSSSSNDWDSRLLATGGTASNDQGELQVLASPLTISHGQVKFPSTQNPSSDANTLDDYKEGTWTPTITAQTGTFTTVSATGNYTKIGRLVSVSIAITITTAGTAAGYVIATLPFTAGSGNWILAGRETNATGKMLEGIIQPSGTGVIILNYDNTSTIGSGFTLVISGSYWV